MICPHCDGNLLRRERTDRRCSKCKRRFALEPQDNALRLHDKRVRRLAERLGDSGRLRYTPEQLWYAAGRGRLSVPGDWFATCGVVLVFAFVVPVAMVCGVLELGAASAVLVIMAAAGMYVLVLLVMWVVARQSRRLDPIRMPIELNVLRAELDAHWPQTYGAMPKGMVTGQLPPEAWKGVEPPVAAVVCHDPAVLVCLAANDLPRRLAVRLCADPEQVPRGLPTVVLHDASPQGVLFAAEVRRVLGSHVTVAGLAPRTVLPAAAEKAEAEAGKPTVDADSGPAKGLRLREASLPQKQTALLREAEPRLTEPELTWLQQGWWFPLAAVRPAALLGMVELGVQRARERVDPGQRAARGVGFLTLPGDAAGQDQPHWPGERL